MQVQHMVFNLHISDQKMAKNYMKITKVFVMNLYGYQTLKWHFLP